MCSFHFPKNAKSHWTTVEKYKKINIYANDIDTGIIKF